MIKSGLLPLVLLLSFSPSVAKATEAVSSEPLAPLESAETFEEEAKEEVIAPEAKAKAEAPVEPEPEKIEHSRILPVKINPIQRGADEASKAAPEINQANQSNQSDPDNLSLYTNQSEGSFGSNLWKGVPRTEILSELSKIPASEFSPAQHSLLKRLLLSQAEIPSSKDTRLASDIFTTRMSKLIELGAYKEAMLLNEKLDTQVATQAAALAGMQAFLANGQVAIACLEQKALDEEMKQDDPFWNHLDKFCQTYIKADGVVSDVSQNLMKSAVAFTQAEKILAPSKFEDLNDRTLVELLALSKSGALDRGKWSVDAASKLKPSVVAFLLAMEPQSVNQKFSLLTVAVAHGIKSPSDLDAAYKEISTSAARASAPKGDWGALVSGTAKFTSASTLKTALKDAAAFSPAAYTPFVEELSGLTPAAPLTPEDARFVLRIFVAAQADIPLGWVNYAYGKDFSEESGESALLRIWNQGDTANDTGSKKPTPQPKALKGKIAPETAFSLILKDFLSETSPDKPTPNSSYDNFLILTGSINYVMPSDELTESLKKAAQAKHLGKTLLYGLQILGGRKVEEIHPSALHQVLMAFKTAGLSEETVSVAHEALAGLTKETKEN
jgi:hypothetical protein